jgi:probable HAF family extracellular repeat protein
MKCYKLSDTRRPMRAACDGPCLFRLHLCALVLVLLTPWRGSAEVRYRVVQLVTNEQVGAISSGTGGINRFGDVVGIYTVERGTNAYPYEWVPFVYRDGTGMVALAGPETLESAAATGINDSGQIAIWGSSSDGLLLAYRYTPGIGLEALGSIGDGTYDQTTGINNLGQVVGLSEVYNGTRWGEYGFLYTDGIGVTNIGSLNEGGFSAARDINDLGQVLGNSGGYAFLYTPETGIVSIGEGLVYAINNHGAAVGELSDTDGWYHAALYIDQATRLLTPKGTNASAYGINDHNVVVGQRNDQFRHVFVWTDRNGVMELDSLIPIGWYAGWPSGINDNGQIACEGGIRGLTSSGAIRLDPIPPKLFIQHSPTNLIVSWSPAWPGLALEATETLSTPDWQPLDTGGTNVVVLPVEAPQRFFRLNTASLAGMCCAPE